MEKTAPNDPFPTLQFFGSLDWASEHHDVVIVDREGVIVASFRFDESAVGWRTFAEKIGSYGHTVAMAVETRCGWVVERLLASGVTVYPVNPRTAGDYRSRKAPSGVKNDQLDAWAIADALRTDGRRWLPLPPEDPRIQELRLLCHDEMKLIAQRTALVNQLRAAAGEYHRTPLEVFEDWTVPSVWAFLEQFPTPALLLKAGRRKWEKFLHTHRMWREESGPQRLDVFAKADQLPVPEGVVRAKSLLVVALARQLRTLETQLGEYRERIQAEFDKHDDAGIFRSLPGAGPKLAPRLLAEFGSDRTRFATPEAIQCHAGTAPVTRQSGRMVNVKLRRACSMELRATIHLWADHSREECAWAAAYYRAKRDQGKSHAAALRCLGQRWLKILWKMWQDKVPYDEARHMLSQRKHGSWVLALVTPKATPSQA